MKKNEQCLNVNKSKYALHGIIRKITILVYERNVRLFFLIWFLVGKNNNNDNNVFVDRRVSKIEHDWYEPEKRIFRKTYDVK